MITIDQTVVFGAGSIVGALTMKFIDHLLTNSRTDKNRKISVTNEACRIFKHNVRSELEGIYQAKAWWGKAALPTIQEKNIRIRRYADTFADILESSSKREFRKATNAYCNYCDSITHEMCDPPSLAYIVGHREMPKVVKDAIFNFDTHVDNLLSFAKEK